MNINKSTKSYVRCSSGLIPTQCAQFKRSKKFIKRSKKDIYDFFKYFEKKSLHRELAKRLHKLNIDKINNELKRLRLSKLINKNISESDLVKLKRLAVLPVKKLRDIASLRNIDTNLSKSDILYALIRSEPIVNEEKYLNDINNELVNKVIDACIKRYHLI